MQQHDLNIPSDVLILGAPREILERYGGRLHRFSGEFSDAVHYTIDTLPSELVVYAVIHAADGNWYELADIRRLYRDIGDDRISGGRRVELASKH
jgi:hypothetical protein